MVELYRIKKDGEVNRVEKTPFANEPVELENFVMKNEKLFGNVAILHHQIETPDKKRIDIWGLDTLELRPLIIELKNVPTGIEIIPQILPYYNFVKSNPDTLKFNALSDKNFIKKLEKMEFDKDKLPKALEGDPKVILIAPSFNQELLDVVDYITFDVELIEISRYNVDDESLATINKPKISTPVPAIVRVMEEWNWEKYKKEGISAKKIKIAQGLKEQLDAIIEKENIDVHPIFRKLYIPYQVGRNNVFFVDLSYTSWTTGDVRLGFMRFEKEPDLSAEGVNIDFKRTKYWKDSGEWSIFFDKVVDLSPLVPLIKRAYDNVTGSQSS